MKNSFVVLTVLCAASALAMPTQQELKKAQPLVAELMAPIMDDFKAKKKTAAEVADAAVKYAGEAETEAAKFMLYRSSIPYYVRGEAYDKAAEAVVQLKSNVKSVPAEVVAEIISKATVRANKEKAPRLFELYQQAKTQATAEKDVKELRKKPASTTNKRKLAEALATTGNWQEALKEFASLTDLTAQMAKGEQDGSAKSAALGEFWWSYKPTYENAEDTFKIHAAAHYRKALAAGEITGLKKNIVEQRIKEYGDAAEVAGGMTGGQGTGVCSRTPAATGLYCVIDLSGGPDAKKYPVSYLSDMPKGGWSDEYKTTKLVLRRIEPGSPVLHGEGAQQRRVSIDAAYYIGVFEVTQGQWEKIMGTRPSFLRGKKYALRPVEQVSYDMIRGRERGSEWPESNRVDADSFIGCLRARTGLDFDLPTNGQWEYACCAGVGTDYNNGGKCTGWERNPTMDVVGRYQYNGGWNEEKWGKYEFSKIFKTLDRECDPENGTAVVGSYAPNNWGLYDMHGNVFEWCLDRKGEPEGNLIRRVVRSGWWIDKAADCCAFVCKQDKSNHAALWHGFRLCLPLAGGAAKSVSAATAPSTGSIELKTGGGSPFTVKGNEATLDMGGKYGKLEFVKCPAGTVKMVLNTEGKTKRVKISRPFWITKTPILQDNAFISPAVPAHNQGNYACLGRKEADSVISAINDEYGESLPKGMVVRLATLAELEYAYHANTLDRNDPYYDALHCHAYDDVGAKIHRPPRGKTVPNAWGLYDFADGLCLDKFDPVSVIPFGAKEEELVKAGKRNFWVRGLPDIEKEEDPLYWTDAQNAGNVSRNFLWARWLLVDERSRASVGGVRLVIGPDLVSEWKAKNAKK